MFEQLDFIYQPSRDVAADVEYYTGALGAEFVFAVERFGIRVAPAPADIGRTRAAAGRAPGR
jgi:hypothetical protein